MKEDFSELVEYLDKKFARIDGEFNLVKGELKMKADKTDLEDKADKLDVNNLLTAIDGYAKKS